ncbi:hypothetical protein EXIGLDRAFT_773540 [Exidia glandulosa HHB12029]|uniref:F-box domain-containing protein n=1 Tax=Exidia glandulosa HHB12029 TaxID=1314781 RepID=A0A165ERY6_EXIGL|nr:hypothetical protein EXIGLDRAFT_773540 [Exidia glandulosa HHB12029]
MVASIDDLPTELIAQIFVDALQPEQWHGTYLVYTLPPLLVVCRRWRDVAHDTPTLWRYIHLDLDLIADTASEARCRAFMDVFVLRAKGSVALSVFISEEDNPYQASIWLELRRLVGSVCWSFSLVAHEDETVGCAPQITACLDQVAPRLEVLHLEYQVNISEYAVWTLPRAPKLRELGWDTLTTIFRWPSDIETFPLLRTIRACVHAGDGHDDAAQVAEILRRCPHLVTLDLQLYHDFRATSPIRLEAESLRTLNIDGEALVSSMSTLRLPNLENARISSIPTGVLPTLFRGPLATVTRLDVGSSIDRGAGGTFARSLLDCPRLQHLRWINPDHETLAEFLEVMSKPLPSTDAWICPRLLSLTLLAIELQPSDTVVLKIWMFARSRTEPSLDSADDTFTGRLQRLESLAILPPYRPTPREYGWLTSTLEGLRLSTANAWT